MRSPSVGIFGTGEDRIHRASDLGRPVRRTRRAHIGEIQTSAYTLECSSGWFIISKDVRTPVRLGTFAYISCTRTGMVTADGGRVLREESNQFSLLADRARKCGEMPVRQSWWRDIARICIL